MWYKPPLSQAAYMQVVNSMQFRDKKDPTRDTGCQDPILGLSRPFRDAWQPYRMPGHLILGVLAKFSGV